MFISWRNSIANNYSNIWVGWVVSPILGGDKGSGLDKRQISGVACFIVTMAGIQRSAISYQQKRQIFFRGMSGGVHRPSSVERRTCFQIQAETDS